MYARLDTMFSELYIPAKILPYGVYRLDLKVTMNVSLEMTSSASAFVNVVRSNLVFSNLMPFGTSMITLGYEQDLALAPGQHSLDLDQDECIENVRSLLLIVLSLTSVFHLELGVRILLSHL
jgi:REJ domain